MYQRPDIKRFREKHWFRLWIEESYSVRQLSDLSGHSPFKIKQIKNHWLDQVPREHCDYSSIRYLLYDGTYFHKKGCWMSLMNAEDQNIISCIYAAKEGFKSVFDWFMNLKEHGLNPLCITMDGERFVMRVIREVWPETKIQRCLYHIQREGMRWLRSFPKTQAGRELRAILSTLASVKSFKDRDVFIELFHAWINAHYTFILSLASSTIQFKDLKRTVTLIKNALPDMFHYLHDSIIPHTTNALEGFYSRLKADYQRHRGLSEQHKISYLNWYCFYKNSNNF